MIEPVFVVAYSGHRPHKQKKGRAPKDLEGVRSQVRKALQRFQKEVKECAGHIELLGGVAAGSDLIICQEAEELKIPVHVILPCDEERFLSQHGGTAQERLCAERIIARSRDADQPGTYRGADASVSDPECYSDANFQMIRSSDALLSICNRDDSGQAGGTAAVWRFAEESKLPRININPADENAVPEECCLDCLIDPQSPSSGMAIIDHLAAESQLWATDIGDDDYFGQLHERLDRLAIDLAVKTREMLFWTIGLHGTASLLAAFGIAYALASGPNNKLIFFWVSAVEFILIGIAEWLHRKQHTAHQGERWLRIRRAAELVRPLKQTKMLLDPLHPVIQIYLPQWRRFVLSMILRRSQNPCSTWENCRDKYLELRVRDQIRHFSDKKGVAQPKFDRISQAIRGVSVGALLVVFFAAGVKGAGLDWNLFKVVENEAKGEEQFHIISLLLYFLPVALPLLAGILLATRQSFDIGRRAFRYAHMETLLQRSKADLEAVNSEHALRQVVLRTEMILASELVESNSAQRVGLTH